MASSWRKYMRRERLPIPTISGVRVAYRGVVSDTTAPEPESDEPVTAEVVPDPAPVATPTPVAPEETGYTSAGVPTFDYVREKIETSFGNSVGATELASETPEGRRIEEQYEARQQAAADRLAQIREAMKNEQS